MRDVQFKLVKREDGPDQEVVEIRLNDATVAAFPADEKARDTDKTYRQLYANEYDRFKRGDKGEKVIRPVEDESRKATVTGPTIDETAKPASDALTLPREEVKARAIESNREPTKRTVKRRKASHK